MTTCEHSKSSWTFTMELLPHVHQLRVFLHPSPSQVHDAWNPVDIEVALLCAPPTLSCSWKADIRPDKHLVHLPLPVLLFDHSSSPRASAVGECIQVSIHLLPLSDVHIHAFSLLSFDCTGVTATETKSVVTDTVFSGTVKGIHCQCDENSLQIDEKSCIHKRLQPPVSIDEAVCITHYPAQNPGEDHVLHEDVCVRERACFEFKSKQRDPDDCKQEEKADKYLPCINGDSIERSDDFKLLQSAEADGSEDYSSKGATILTCKNCSMAVTRNHLRYFVQLPCLDWREVAENWFGTCCCSFGSMAEFLSVRFEKSLQLQPGKCFVGPSTFYVDYSDVIVPNESSLHGRDVTAEQLHIPFLAVGNGFMVWDNQHSKHVKWTPVHCSNCASLLGSYPYTCTDSGFSREGLHLFRCQVIPCKGDGTLFDTYRYETFKSLLVKELRKRTDENASHRFLVQSLISGLPLLQLIILNYDALICTGRVFGDMEDWSCYTKTSGSLPSAIELQKCIKVLFVDCTSFSEDDRRQTELWAKEHDAEAFFMLEDFVEKLRDELSVNSLFYHSESDGLFHSFQCSFIQGE